MWEGRAKVPGMKLAVEAEGLVKQYQGRSGTVDAVRGVDLSVEAGEVFGFLGPNGAGKSTTIKMLTTLMSITAGTARVADLDVTAEPQAVRRRIGVALQEAGPRPRQGHRAARAGRPRGGRRPAHQGLLRRDEASPRPRLGAGP